MLFNSHVARHDTFSFLLENGSSGSRSGSRGKMCVSQLTQRNCYYKHFVPIDCDSFEKRWYFGFVGKIILWCNEGQMFSIVNQKFQFNRKFQISKLKPSENNVFRKKQIIRALRNSENNDSENNR